MLSFFWIFILGAQSPGFLWKLSTCKFDKIQTQIIFSDFFVGHTHTLHPFNHIITPIPSLLYPYRRLFIPHFQDIYEKPHRKFRREISKNRDPFFQHLLWGWIREDLLESLKKPKLLQPNPKVAGRDVAGLIFETQPESPSFFSWNHVFMIWEFKE